MNIIDAHTSTIVINKKKVHVTALYDLNVTPM
jgi:hypothetical protein